MNEWRVQAQNKFCVLCNLAQTVAPVPVQDLSDGASSSPPVFTVATAISAVTSSGNVTKKGGLKTRAAGERSWPTTI